MAKGSIVDPVGVDAVPDAHHFGALTIVDHEIVLKGIKPFRVEESNGAVGLLDNGVLQEAQFGLIALLVKDEHKADDVLVALLDVVGLGQLEQLSLFLVDVLSLEPLSHRLGSPFSTERHGLVFVLSIQEENSREAFNLILAHELLVLTSVNTGDVHSFSNKLRKLAVLRLEISAVATLNKGKSTPGE